MSITKDLYNKINSQLKRLPYLELSKSFLQTTYPCARALGRFNDRFMFHLFTWSDN